MTTISAKSVLASKHAQHSARIDTLLLRYPRWIHAELMTHRVFSRNAASSRAIPVEKMIDDILADPAYPIFWGKNQPGMQAFEELSDGAAQQARMCWERSLDAAVREARYMVGLNAHKQIINRILEPFMHITVLVSSTQWSNFLALRDHQDAEPHFQLLARRVREALETAEPQVLNAGEWHLPFVESVDSLLIDSIALSVARCASTSYKTVDGFDMTQERARALHDRLVSSQPLHASPAEHVCAADEWTYTGWRNPDLHGNFTGFNQYRKMLVGECL